MEVEGRHLEQEVDEGEEGRMRRRWRKSGRTCCVLNIQTCCCCSLSLVFTIARLTWRRRWGEVGGGGEGGGRRRRRRMRRRPGTRLSLNSLRVSRVAPPRRSQLVRWTDLEGKEEEEDGAEEREEGGGEGGGGGCG